MVKKGNQWINVKANAYGKNKEISKRQDCSTCTHIFVLIDRVSWCRRRNNLHFTTSRILISNSLYSFSIDLVKMYNKINKTKLQKNQIVYFVCGKLARQINDSTGY
ncbi:hypothetical protein RDWZM_005707 [Blomia tropicalis]|uniref:Uncharacterized protein n=1 Tax=Blomia tropicalis TaxID=40697 RepID=A0A9Q0RMV7_BLOTA|nr:hypothetical protein RDWZM_005707 [Blomia tropicalis]